MWPPRLRLRRVPRVRRTLAMSSTRHDPFCKRDRRFLDDAIEHPGKCQASRQCDERQQHFGERTGHVTAPQVHDTSAHRHMCQVQRVGNAAEQHQALVEELRKFERSKCMNQEARSGSHDRDQCARRGDHRGGTRYHCDIQQPTRSALLLEAGPVHGDADDEQQGPIGQDSQSSQGHDRRHEQIPWVRRFFRPINGNRSPMLM